MTRHGPLPAPPRTGPRVVGFTGVRNREIVADSELLIACPRTRDEVLRSGVWATIRAMRRARRPLYLVAPDGALSVEPPHDDPDRP